MSNGHKLLKKKIKILQVSTMGAKDSVEYLTFINHTECHCVSRHNNRDHLHHGSHRHPHNHSMTTTNDSTTATVNYSPTGNNCQCVKHFHVIHQRIESSDEDDGVDKSNQSCRCDCEAENISCDWLKKGKDGFSIEDRR